jgi:hypothetical protein
MPARKARKAWVDAMDSLLDASSGTYTWGVFYQGRDHAFVAEDGVFDLDPVRSTSERTINGLKDAADAEPDEVLKIVRRDHTIYVQSSSWDRWGGCWMQTTNAEIQQQSGIDMTRSPDLPVAVVAMGDATVTKQGGDWFPDPYLNLLGHVNAVEALQFLGVAPAAFRSSIDKLLRVEVPITVAIGVDERPLGAGLYGDELIDAVKAAHVKLDRRVTNLVSDLSASLRIGALGQKVTVTRPRPRTLLPPHATQKDYCPAKRPVA